MDKVIKQRGQQVKSIIVSLHFNERLKHAESYKAKVSKLHTYAKENICGNCVVLPACSKSFECESYINALLPKLKRFLKKQERKIK